MGFQTRAHDHPLFAREAAHQDEEKAAASPAKNKKGKRAKESFDGAGEKSSKTGDLRVRAARGFDLE